MDKWNSFCCGANLTCVAFLVIAGGPMWLILVNLLAFIVNVIAIFVEDN